MMKERIFNIVNSGEFEALALDIFRYQAENCPPYKEYLDLIGVTASKVKDIYSIPMLPIELFKSHKVYSSTSEPQIIFTSSATTGLTPSKHYVADLKLYERDFTDSFRLFYGDIESWSIYGLLPNYLQRQGSSLVYMVDRLIKQCGSGGFYLNNYKELLSDMASDSKPKILLGVTYALLDLAEQFAPKLTNTIIMETGGMKGYREEMAKSQLHSYLCSVFGVETIHSEYGMAELMSQCYSKADGVFTTPPWMKILIRDINDPFARLEYNRRGAIDIIDLGNIDSCSFIATQDAGRALNDNQFIIEGRVNSADIRGCNLLVQQ